MRAKRSVSGSVNRDERGAGLKRTDSDTGCCCGCVGCGSDVTLNIVSPITLCTSCRTVIGPTAIQIDTPATLTGSFELNENAPGACGWNLNRDDVVSGAQYFSGSSCSSFIQLLQNIRFNLSGSAGTMLMLITLGNSTGNVPGGELFRKSLASGGCPPATGWTNFYTSCASGFSTVNSGHSGEIEIEFASLP